MHPWELVAMLSTGVGGLALAGRYTLRAWSLYQLKVLARESHALHRWWSVIAELPAELLTQPLRCTLGRIMYQHVKRARRVQPEHPFLRAQLLQVARFIGRTPRDAGRRLTGTTREKAIAALTELNGMLFESEARQMITRGEMARCAASVSQALTQLEFAHYRQAALQAEYLHRVPQAIEYLRSALRSAQAFGRDSTQCREVEARLQALEGRDLEGVGAAS